MYLKHKRYWLMLSKSVQLPNIPIVQRNRRCSKKRRDRYNVFGLQYNVPKMSVGTVFRIITTLYREILLTFVNKKTPTYGDTPQTAPNHAQEVPHHPTPGLFCLPAQRLPAWNDLLHRTAYEAMIEESEFMQLINPRKCTKDQSCPYYRSNKPVTFAKGFTNFQKRMFPEQYKKFMQMLITKFGRNAYFQQRRGDVCLSPKEQAFILETLKTVGVDEEMKFDEYFDQVSWYN